MRDLILGVLVGGVALAGLPGFGQMHKVAKPEQVVRAVGVYEWTGDLAKPTGSRLIPISLFIDGQFQDAGVYMAQPIPFALDPGNVYELKDAGADKGTVDLEYAKHLQTANSDYDDGWFGYGSFKATVAEAPKIVKKLPPARTQGIVSSVADSDRPTLVRKQGSDSDAAGSGQSTTASSGSTASAGSTPADDPNRPTMQRRSDSSGSSTTSSSGSTTANSGSTTASSGSAPASSGSTTSASTPGDDPDRPTLKRRTPEEAKKAKEDAEASVTGMVGSLNDDPSRPKLHFGRPEGVTTGADLPKLVGLPTNLHQMVAVSDAVNREPHEFVRPWADEAERAAILVKMEAVAQAQLAAYGAHAAPTTVAKKPTVASTSRHKAATPTVALMDEVLKGYTLSYGGDPTYVYMAQTAGTGAALRYVTIVAQTDEMGEFKVAIKNVTDADHLDRTAQMKFVDVVDADATNRASLLFELREQSSRQFALYRLIAAESQQIFISGTTQ